MLAGELRKHCPVEDLLRGELAGLRVDERELDDGGQDMSESGQEGEASEVALQVVHRRGHLEAEANGRQHSPLQLKVFRWIDLLLRTGEECLWRESLRNFASFVELNIGGSTLMARQRQARKRVRYYETCRS
jgi:hypothetical protein